MEPADDALVYQAPAFTWRHTILTQIPHVTGALSVIGSTCIIVDIARDRKKWNTAYHRLLVGMAISDILASTCLALSTVPIPEWETVYGAQGNVATCETQGFFIQLGLATPLYSAFLAIYFLLQVAFCSDRAWKEGGRRLRCLEGFFHVFSWGLAFGTAFASLGLKLYNNANLWCWIAPMPLDCINSVQADDGVSTCVRGDNAWVYRLSFYFIWLWLAVAAVAISMGMILHAVLRQTKRMQKYRQKGQPASKAQSETVRRVAVQSALFVGSFVVTALPLSLVRGFQAKYNCTSEYFPLSLLTATLFPLQGFWNFVIYARPRYLRYRAENRSSGVFSLLVRSVNRTFATTVVDDDDYKLGTMEEEQAEPPRASNASADTHSRTDDSVADTDFRDEI